MPMKIDTEETESINVVSKLVTDTVVVPIPSTVTEEEEDIMKLLEEET